MHNSQCRLLIKILTGLFIILSAMLTNTLILAGGPSINQAVSKFSNSIPQLSHRINRDSRGRKLYKENEIIVSFKKSVSTLSSRLMIQQYASATHHSFGKNQKFNVVTIDASQSLSLVMAQFRSESSVKSVDYNYYVYSLAVPNDTFYGQQWGLSNPEVSIIGVEGTTRADINIERVWDHITDCRSVVVAVIDTGINYTHTDLASNMVITNMWDFVDNDDDPYPDAGNESHGTNVAGIIGARGNNGIGTSGVCWQAKILPLRVLDENGAGTLANVASAIIHAVDNGAKVINLSLGAAGTTTAMDDAMNHARDNKVVIVAAAGNDANDNDNSPFYPCNYTLTHINVICVAAMNRDYKLASFSNSGVNTVDVGAPGVAVYNTISGEWIIDNMIGWVLSGNWLEAQCSLPNPNNMLLNPQNYCDDSGPYANNVNDVVYKNFDLSTANRAKLIYEILYSTQPEADKINVNSKSAGGDPFVAGMLITSHSGNSPTAGTVAEANFLDLNNCFTATCTIGFQLKTDASITGRGVAISRLRIETSQINADSYLNYSGTSQAAPHVAGLAAMLIAWNPAYEDSQVINAIKSGGTLNSDLTGITSTGRVINAMGSLKFVNIPTGVTVTIP